MRRRKTLEDKVIYEGVGAHARECAIAARMPTSEEPDLPLLGSNVIVAALGNFVDVYDLMIFGIVRVPSLQAVGVPPERMLSEGVFLINAQMIGMLLGGLLWGIIGDKRGRLAILLGSIALYSVANIANGFVNGVLAYGALRFIAGVGLAGELGAAITLISETMSRERRGYGTTIIAGIGVMGAIVAAWIGDLLSWRAAYVVGGVLGLVLLGLRVSMLESGMFEAAKKTATRRGDLRLLLRPPSRLARYAACVAVGIPIWFMNGILVTFSPELGRELGIDGKISAGKAIIYYFVGTTVGNFGSGWVSQLVRSRKHVLAAFLLWASLVISGYIFSRGVITTPTQFYLYCLPLGVAGGYWAVFMANAAEQFGTNLRATVTTSVPNLTRGAVVPLTLAFQALSVSLQPLGAALLVGGATVLLALVALWYLPETFGKDLNYCEQ